MSSFVGALHESFYFKRTISSVSNWNVCATVFYGEHKKPKKKQDPVKNGVKQKPLWLEHAQYGVELLKAHFPACFKEIQEIQPLKVGIKQDLVIRLGSKDNIVLSDKACMVSSLSYYVSSPSYHKNVLAGATRIDLDGHPAGTVTPEEAHYSLECRRAKLQKKGKVAASTACA